MLLEISLGALRNFAKFKWKYLGQSLFLIKLETLGLRPATLLKKETLAQVFSCEFCEISKNTLTKLLDPNKRKMRFHYFELRWLLNGMDMPWHSVFSFLFFLFKNKVTREQLDENDFRCCYFFSRKYHFESTWSQVRSKFFINNHESTWQQHLKDTLQLNILWTSVSSLHQDI